MRSLFELRGSASADWVSTHGTPRRVGNIELPISTLMSLKRHNVVQRVYVRDGGSEKTVHHINEEI